MVNCTPGRCAPGKEPRYPLSGTVLANTGPSVTRLFPVMQFKEHDAVEHYVATLLAEKIIKNYNSSLLRPHSKPIFLCFIEFSEAYYLVIKPYVLFVNGGLLVNSTPSTPFDICI